MHVENCKWQIASRSWLILGCLALAISCSRDPGRFPESTSADQEGFFLRLEAVRAELREAKRTADRELGKAGNLTLTFDSMGRKGVAEQARKRFREQREQIERPAREKWKGFLKEIEGLAVHSWYGRIERLPLGTRPEMLQPRCEIASGRVRSEGPIAEKAVCIFTAVGTSRSSGLGNWRNWTGSISAV